MDLPRDKTHLPAGSEPSLGEQPPSPETLRSAYLELRRLRPTAKISHFDVRNYLSTLGRVVAL